MKLWDQGERAERRRSRLWRAGGAGDMNLEPRPIEGPHDLHVNKGVGTGMIG
jgi:hypothetical protein